MPFLRKIQTKEDRFKPDQFPFTIPAFSAGIQVEFSTDVTFLVGENGSGKSTLLEAIAEHCGFNPSGGNRNHAYAFRKSESTLAEALRFSWFPKVTDGFFLRAESFFNFASYIDDLAEDDSGILGAYGGKSLHQQSHGESYLALFENKFRRGIYLLDEPEAALSPKRQLSLMALIHQLEKSGKAQFIIATHSPILLGYPDAVLLSLDGEQIQLIAYEDTDHYRITKEFLMHPQLYLRYLFEDEE
jgi:predicted ATPase